MTVFFIFAFVSVRFHNFMKNEKKIKNKGDINIKSMDVSVLNIILHNCAETENIKRVVSNPGYEDIKEEK